MECYFTFAYHSHGVEAELREIMLIGTRPSKQCGFCNYLLDQSLISQDCQSGLIGQSGRGGAGCPNCPRGPLVQVVQVVKVSRSQGLRVSRSQGLKISRSHGLKV